MHQFGSHRRHANPPSPAPLSPVSVLVLKCETPDYIFGVQERGVDMREYVGLLSRSLPPSVSFSLSLSLSLSLALSLSVSISLSRARALSRSLSRARCHSLSRALSLSLAVARLQGRTRHRVRHDCAGELENKEPFPPLISGLQGLLEIKDTHRPRVLR